ncbi:hypothetical protein BCD_1824 (plasmid) [Borrelia crocidurae DOU]|uniref:Variable outer membrane protein n=1 Tax=Borrelia crocidurae DOU TaxID=1293575 RepID=W5SM18_9SPIR|nr:hypothetical protein BCD_1824 [Borrelia crocidurae DOU]
MIERVRESDRESKENEKEGNNIDDDDSDGM